MGFVAQMAAWLNVPFNALGRFLGVAIENMPGWASNTMISGVTGIVFVLIFKYTSNQKAIGLAKDRTKAHTLAMKLFKDDPGVTIRSLGGHWGGPGIDCSILWVRFL